MLIEHMSQGWPFSTFAADLNVSIDTLYEWAKVHPEFSEAKKIGYAKSYKHWIRIGLDGALDPAGMNNTTWIYTMKCRFRNVSPDENWADKDKEDKSHEQSTAEDIKAIAEFVKKTGGK